MSNYNVKSLYHSINGGQSFTPIEGNLDGTEDNPGPSIRSVYILPSGNGNLYFAATSIGLFSTAQLNGSNTVWTQTAGDLIGNTVTEYVTGRKSDGKVFVGTHGRGAFVGETDGTAGTAVATLSVNQLNINVKPDATANANFTIQNTGTANLNYSITASGGSSKPVIDNKIEKLIISSDTDSQNSLGNGIKSERAINKENSLTKLMSIDSEDVLYNDDGDDVADIFLGYGNYTGFMWMNKFDLHDYGFDLQKIRVYMRSENSFTNGFAYTIYNQNEEYVALGYAEAANSKEGQWFEATLDQTYSFPAGESFYIQIDAYNLAYNPGGIRYECDCKE